MEENDVLHEEARALRELCEQIRKKPLNLVNLNSEEYHNQAANQQQIYNLIKGWEENQGVDDVAAFECMERLHILAPDNHAFALNYGMALLNTGNPAEAKEVFENLLDKVDFAPSNYMMACEYLGDRIEDRKSIIPYFKYGRRLHRRPRRDRKMICYLSQDGSAHVVGQLLFPVICNHNRDKYVIVYLHDGNVFDPMTEAISKHVDIFLDVHHLPSWQIENTIRGLSPDVLVDTGGHSNGGKRLSVFAHKSAPIQIEAIGYPGEMVLPVFDARIGSESISWHTTRTMINPFGYTPFRRKTGVTSEMLESHEAKIRLRRIEQEQGEKIQVAIIEPPMKITGDDLDCWRGFMDSNPNVELTFFRTYEQYGESLRAEICKCGERAEVVVSGQYLDLLRNADIIMTTSNWAGHIKTMDAATFGIPTFQSNIYDSAPSKLTTEVYRQLGIGECLETATHLINNPKQLENVRLDLMRAANSIDNAKAWTIAYEEIIDELISEVDWNTDWVEVR